MVLRTFLVATLKAVRQVSGQGGLLYKLRAGRRALSILLNLREHLNLVHLMSHPNVVGLTEQHPQIIYKYLNPYLSRNFSRRARLSILTNHYTYLKDNAVRDFQGRIFGDGEDLWKVEADEHLLSIKLLFPRGHDYEGDLRLVFACDSVTLYGISFTIVPKKVVSGVIGQAVLVSSIQGAPGKFELLKEVTKKCEDVTPLHLLLAAVEGLALSFGFDMIVGMGVEHQIAVNEARGQSKNIFFDYDEFWTTYVTNKTNDHFYLIPIPLPEKPIELIKAKYRSRTLRKRELKKTISDRVRFHFERNLLMNTEERNSSADMPL